MYAETFGLTEPDVPAEFARRVGAVFATEAMESAGGAMWSHPALSGRDRSIAIISALVAQGVVDGDRLETHLARAVRAGIDQEALEVLMTVLAGYAGYPLASRAAEAVQSHFR
ncbi:hypothetical protein AX769_17150 [Frondihabitans sp. PAMC 28766]|uniref:carboxymuconolactone decarboxylase family protein n=1 Tax=Frondihabitans sp. PAMC 28766 TaxID=1795630 RepID=UPI00078D59E8|nr:carboxymuconolactone decarboxylase family protein [Frondihabitans sp. PAMC 28766]AMM21553.1 hypothetical protein AX769_17150 [Frondihabitans sp. PAMC 28766]